MALSPRNPKEMMRLLLRDPDLKREMHDVLTRADNMVQNDMSAAIKHFLERNQVDIRLMSHTELATTFKAYYKKISLYGNFVKMF